jgi:hypothetical protein
VPRDAPDLAGLAARIERIEKTLLEIRDMVLSLKSPT